MYGLLLQAALEFISSKFSVDTAQHVLTEAAGGGALDGRIGLGRAGFSIHQLYSDKLLIRLAQSTADASNLRLDQVMEQFGHFFVRYTHQAGYESLLRILGRNLSDFVLGLDNLHEYFRGTYPKIKAPSFSVVQEDTNGMTICYRSTRGNLHGYVAGQLSEVARLYYGITIAVSAQPPQIDARGKHAVLMRLDFENSSYLQRRSMRLQLSMLHDDTQPPHQPQQPLSQVSTSTSMTTPLIQTLAKVMSESMEQQQLQQQHLKLSDAMSSSAASSGIRQQRTSPETMFEKISFYIILNRELEIVSVGRGIAYAMPGAMGRDFNEVFELIRPAIPCNWPNILDYANNVFEIHSLQPIQTHFDDLMSNNRKSFGDTTNTVSDRIERFIHLKLRGQMIHFEEWDCLIFLAMPIIDTLKELNMLGLKVHDMSMMDSSRELITMRHHRDIGKDPLMMQEAKIGNRLDTLNDEANMYRHRRASLLEEAIPRFILKSSDKLTKIHYSNKAAVIGCCLTFNKAVTSPPVIKEVIMTLNSVFRKFDIIADKYNLCKILSFANDYLLVVGIPFHATLPANLAILIAEDLIDAAEVSNDVSSSSNIAASASAGKVSDTQAMMRTRMRKSIISDIQVAIDIGPVIGTVIAVTMPRYVACGRPITIAQRIASIAIPNAVTVTESVVIELKKNEFSLNYDYKPLVTIQMPLLAGSENLELYTVCSIGRRLKRDELAAARANRRRAGRVQGSIASVSSSTTASAIGGARVDSGQKDSLSNQTSVQPPAAQQQQNQSNTLTAGERKINKLIKMSAMHGDSAIPLSHLMAHQTLMTEEAMRSVSAMSSAASHLNSPTSRCSTQLGINQQLVADNGVRSGVSTPVDANHNDAVGRQGVPNGGHSGNEDEDVHEISVPIPPTDSGNQGVSCIYKNCAVS